MAVSRVLKAILGEDPFEQKRNELKAERERLEAQAHQAVLDLLRDKFPNKDPEDMAKQYSGLVKAVEGRVRSYYESTYRTQLEFLQRLEAGG